jgi:hypothetical protein
MNNMYPFTTGIDDTVSMELEQYANYVYYVFAIIFGLYFLDGAYYLLVALLARIAESVWPIVGHPSYRGRRHEAHKMEAAQRVSAFRAGVSGCACMNALACFSQDHFHEIDQKVDVATLLQHS